MRVAGREQEWVRPGEGDESWVDMPGSEVVR